MKNRRDIKIGFWALIIFFAFILLSFIMIISSNVKGVHVSEKTVGIVEITGPIMSSKSAVDKLEKYIKNNKIPAVVIRLNTPGGAVAPTQEIYETVIKAKKAGKKVIASMGTAAASGGYYIAAACDSIVAAPATITGSIGVIATFADFSELYRKIGIDFNVRKSGKFKDIGSTSRKMTDEEKAVTDSLIMDIYDQFVTAVAEGRKLKYDFVKSIATGQVYTGRQAKKLGLVDRLGTYQDAVDLAGILSGIGKNPPVTNENKGFLWDLMDEGTEGMILKNLNFKMPDFLYMLSY